MRKTLIAHGLRLQLNALTHAANGFAACLLDDWKISTLPSDFPTYAQPKVVLGHDRGITQEGTKVDGARQRGHGILNLLNR
jgi:hypothetical protein